MNKVISILIVGTAVVLVGCAGSAPRIVTNADPDADFTDFTTYNFMQPLSSDNGTARTLTSSFLIKATIRELQSLGLKPAGHNPDLLIDFIVSTDVSDLPRQVPARNPHYATWTSYNMQRSTLHATQRTEGTIAVDVVDNAKQQLIWEGAATGMVTESRRENLQETVDDAIANIFADFPN